MTDLREIKADAMKVLANMPGWAKEDFMPLIRAMLLEIQAGLDFGDDASAAESEAFLRRRLRAWNRDWSDIPWA